MRSKNRNILFSYDSSKLAEIKTRMGDRQDFSTSEYCFLFVKSNLPTYSMHDFSGIFFSYEHLFLNSPHSNYHVLLFLANHLFFIKFLQCMLETGLVIKKYMDLKQLSSYSFLPVMCAVADSIKHFERKKIVSIWMHFCLLQKL